MGLTNADIFGLYASGEFDADYYLKTYPDVGETGLDPAAHFLWIGARLGRLAKPPRALLQGSSDDRLDVLFVDGTNGTSSTPYRVTQVAEGLSQHGVKVRCLRGDELIGAAVENLRARFVTFFRAPLWESYRSFAEKMRARGSKIVFDIDDLVFEEELIPEIDGYRWLTEPEKLGYIRGVRAYRDFVLYADFCTAPTEFLASRMRLLGKKAFRIRNTLARSEIAKFTGATVSADRDKFVVGYYSGSKTHQADFRHAGEALAPFMEEHSSVEFRLVGQFDLTEYPTLQKWSAGDESERRVRQLGLMPHSAMLEDQLQCDVIIAPLEVDNPFCEAKSELKFFEASLVRRPVIASPTLTFRDATRDGRYAQLADGSDEWLKAYRCAFAEIDRLRTQAAQAHEYVIGEYSPEAAGGDAIEAYSGGLGAEQYRFSMPSSAVVNSNPTG